MPAKRKAPQADFRKRFLHTFYLVQPVLQFVALLSLMLVLSRCSPLAPSTEKTLGVKPSPSQGEVGNNSEDFLKEDQIAKSLKLLPSSKLSVISETEFSEAAADSLQTEQPVRENEVKTRLERRKKRMLGASAIHLPILTINLTADQQQALWREGSVRIALTDYLQSTFELNARKLLFRDLQSGLDKIGARPYAVVSDDAAAHNGGSELSALRIDLKVSLGVLSDEKAYLEIRRTASAADPAALIAAAQDARKLAVVLE